MVELVALELESRKSFKTVSFAGMKTRCGPASRGRQVGAQKDERKILKDKAAVATSQIRQEVPGGEKK